MFLFTKNYCYSFRYTIHTDDNYNSVSVHHKTVYRCLLNILSIQNVKHFT